MARPCKCRRIYGSPSAECFKPRGVPVRLLEEVTLTIDEFEALRLADLEGLYQEQAAEKMKVSRQTFGNILESAHRAVADSLVNAKLLRIKGGTVEMVERHFLCSECKHEWALPHGSGRPCACPKCNCSNIHRAPHDRGYARAGVGRGRGRCGRTG
jgi:predicted DNA-binding protein (UPF0251 family)